MSIENKYTRMFMDELLLAPDADSQLEEMRKCGALANVFPVVQAMVGFGGGTTGHKDLWEHTKKVVVQVEPRLPIRWAALFHDVGKVITISSKGKVSFHGHEAVSEKLFHITARRLDMFMHSELKQIMDIIYNVGHVESYGPSWTDSAVRRIDKQMGASLLTDLMALARGDVTTKHQSKRDRYLAHLNEFEARVIELRRQDSIPPALPKGLGDAITKTLGIPPSPALGAVMGRLKAAVEAGEIPRNSEIQVYLGYLMDSRGARWPRRDPQGAWLPR